MRRCGVRVRRQEIGTRTRYRTKTYNRTVTRVAYSLIRYAGRARDIAREQTGRHGGEFRKQVSPLWN